ncbi:MAG: hypothetical protein KDD64_07915 [Bdellovibrionales bacterium]|nr:hypothetical protein [Bdellovibrionales bacterium]
MTRISESQIFRQFQLYNTRNREQVNKYSNEISTGLKVLEPGDTKQGSTISKLRESLVQIDENKKRASAVFGYLNAMDGALDSAADALIRAQEIATQAANETNSAEDRAIMAQEVYELREFLVSLANTKYQDQYIFSGNSDNTPAFSGDHNAFADPPEDVPASIDYQYDGATGASSTRSVNVTDTLAVQVNQNGEDLFGDAIRGLTQLGRALEGYRTGYTGNPPLPDDAASTPYTFPGETAAQTQDIQAALDVISGAREDDIIRTRTNIAGRLRRVETADSLLNLSKDAAQKTLASLQEADVIESASLLTNAQTALNASLTVTTQILRQSILDYL